MEHLVSFVLDLQNCCSLLLAAELELGTFNFKLPHFTQLSTYFLAFGRLAPYFERRCRRLATPAVSSVPRTMW